MRQSPNAFTLIELLVVITIIVVLLALLTPALDKAIYQAELLVCGTNQRAIGTSTITYAADHKRRYPARVNGRSSMWGDFYDHEPNRFADQVNYDDRTVFEGYYSLNHMFNDLLAGKVDYENTQDTSFLYSPYNLWFGYAFEGFAPMDRMGDRFSWAAPDTEGNTALFRFDLFTSDLDQLRVDDALGAHPDAAGTMTNYVFQDENAEVIGPVELPAVVWALWVKGENYRRGTVDLNFGHADNSVSRIDRIEAEEARPPVGLSERVVPVPDHGNHQDYYPDNTMTLPR